ncbi:MAG TPA: histidine phosphatase family protein [Candidatus Woesebacteria bacterium]|nr:histidine phosphatase family protein [Candidatus Woesebacteria bacterium]
MSTFYLVRHGLRVSRDEDTVLSDVGVRQAKLTGEYLKSKNIQHIFVSPVKRTQHTAEIINSYLQVPQSTDSRLKERMEYEPMHGSFDDFLKEWDKTMANRTYQPSYGDSAILAGNRIISLFEELEDDKNYVCISHGGTIGDVVRNLFSENMYTLTADPSKPLKWLDIPEASVTEIQKIGGIYTLKMVGNISHLVSHD